MAAMMMETRDRGGSGSDLSLNSVPLEQLQRRLQEITASSGTFTRPDGSLQHVHTHTHTTETFEPKFYLWD